jgi:hypothetical protein
MIESEDLQLDFFRPACLGTGDKVVCDGESHQKKDGRWFCISFPAGHDDTSRVMCVGMVNATVRVSVAGADSTIHPAVLFRHGLEPPKKDGKRVRSQPLRLVLVELWRAVVCACGGNSGYRLTENLSTGELPDLLYVSNMSTTSNLGWTSENALDENLSVAGTRYYGFHLFDVESLSTQLLPTKKIAVGNRYGRFFTSPHKGSGLQF